MYAVLYRLARLPSEIMGILDMVPLLVVPIRRARISQIKPIPLLFPIDTCIFIDLGYLGL